jgi:CheY-like chemotaxis protein
LQKAATEGFIAPQEVEKIDRLVSAKFSELAQTIDLKRQHRGQDALAILRGGQGKQLMDEIRDACGQLVAAEEVRINNDLSETIKDGKIRLGLYAGGLVINLLFLGWVYQRIFAEMAARDAATKEIDRQREYLDVTLASLPKAFQSMPVAPKPTSADISPVGVGSLKILMIEDHEDTAIVMARMLKDMGHTVIPADSVASAIDVLTREKFDLILSDVGLPDGNGVSLIHAVRAFCDTPAIALTGYGMREDVERCLQAGFNRHVTKPVTFEALRQIIAEVLANRNEDINEPAGK